MKTVIRTSVLVLLLLALAILPAVAAGISPKEIANEDEAWKNEISDELWAIMNEMSDEDTTLIVMYVKNRPTDEEVDEKVVERTGWAREMFIEMSYSSVHNQEYRDQYNNVFIPAMITKTEEALGLASGTLNQESPQVIETITAEKDKVYDCFREIRAEMFDNFYANIKAVNGIEVLYIATYSGSIGVDATKAEIEFYAKSEDFVALSDGRWLREPQFPDYDYEVSEDPSNEDISADDYSSEYISDAESTDDYSSEYISDAESTDDYSSEYISEEESADNLSSEAFPEGTGSEETCSQEEPKVIPMGDVNVDGVINSLDGAQVLKHDAELIALDREGLAVADVNGDGTVNSLDAAQILKYDAKLITEF
ncbi:MAG: hypothetical protein E7597_01600 [Ruminococcaceae bacterium]|nr:hypothetical protein [Oscillospiraceae bacterium]